MVCKTEEKRKMQKRKERREKIEAEWVEWHWWMTGDEWKKMERVIYVAPWTYLGMSSDERERMKLEGGNENERNKWKDNEIGAEGANKISEALKVNSTLTELDLSCDE